MMRGNRLILPLIAVVALMSAGCRGDDPAIETLPLDDALGGTSAPEVAQTIQVGVELTADWVSAQLTAQSEQAVQSPIIQPTSIALTPIPADQTITSRIGICQTPGGFVAQPRTGFCIATPADWIIESVDGNVASGLNTTPGQVIAITPSWSGGSTACSLMIYLTSDADPIAHLDSRHDAFTARTDLKSLSPIAYQTVGDLLIPGFTWETLDGETGAVYTDLVRANRLVNITHQGIDCSLELLLPALNTLYFE